MRLWWRLRLMFWLVFTMRRATRHASGDAPRCPHDALGAAGRDDARGHLAASALRSANGLALVFAWWGL